MRFSGSSWKRWKRGSALKASTRSAGMLGNSTSCSTVTLTVPSPYLRTLRRSGPCQAADWVACVAWAVVTAFSGGSAGRGHARQGPDGTARACSRPGVRTTLRCPRPGTPGSWRVQCGGRNGQIPMRFRGLPTRVQQEYHTHQLGLAGCCRCSGQGGARLCHARKVEEVVGQQAAGWDAAAAPEEAVLLLGVHPQQVPPREVLLVLRAAGGAQQGAEAVQQGRARLADRCAVWASQLSRPLHGSSTLWR